MILKKETQPRHGVTNRKWQWDPKDQTGKSILTKIAPYTRTELIINVSTATAKRTQTLSEKQKQKIQLSYIYNKEQNTWACSNAPPGFQSHFCCYTGTGLGCKQTRCAVRHRCPAASRAWQTDGLSHTEDASTGRDHQPCLENQVVTLG